MITKENITLYICEFCRKVYQKRHFCIAHESKCTKNPENFDACNGCKFCKETVKHIEHDMCDDYCDDTITKKHRAFYCEKQKKAMHPHSAQKWADRFPDDFEDSECMPNKCELMESGWNRSTPTPTIGELWI